MANTVDPEDKGGLMRKSHWQLWLSVIGGWTLIGLTFALNYYLFADHYVAIFKDSPSLNQVLIGGLPYWFLWAALSPLVFWLTMRFPLERSRLFRNSLVHVIACISLSLIHRAVFLFFNWLLHLVVYRQVSSISDLFRYLLLFNLPTGFMSYGTILLVSYAIDYYRRFQSEEVKTSRLKAELAQAQLQVTQAQLQSLKMQLQPHFLSTPSTRSPRCSTRMSRPRTRWWRVWETSCGSRSTTLALRK